MARGPDGLRKGITLAYRLLQVVGAVALVGALSACERDVILSGQRFESRVPLSETDPAMAGTFVPEAASQENRSVPVAVGAAVGNADWTHRAGSATRAMPHLALSAAPQLQWSVSIGSGNTRKHRIVTAPVVSGGVVYTMDSRNRVSAISAANGGLIWTFDAVPAGENSDTTSGGGLAVGDGKVVVGTAYGEVIALDPARGTPVWRQRFDGPVSGAPAVAGGMVYVSGRDATAWGISLADGRLRWVQPGARQSAGLKGGVAPAVDARHVIMPYASRQVVALDRAKGEAIWSAPLAGQRFGRAAAFIADLTGDPVISGNRVYVGSAAGRTAAFDLQTGARLWEATEGAMGAVWPVGGAVYLVSDLGDLVRLDAATGETVWSVPMGHFTRDTARRQRASIAHYGPVLAGGRLLVASSDGFVRFYAPDSGQELGRIPVAGGAAAPLAVAGGTLFVVTANGQLQAFR